MPPLCDGTRGTADGRHFNQGRIGTEHRFQGRAKLLVIRDFLESLAHDGCLRSEQDGSAVLAFNDVQRLLVAIPPVNVIPQRRHCLVRKDALYHRKAVLQLVVGGLLRRRCQRQKQVRRGARREIGRVADASVVREFRGRAMRRPAQRFYLRHQIRAVDVVQPRERGASQQNARHGQIQQHDASQLL